MFKIRLWGLIYRDIIAGFAASKANLAYNLLTPILYVFIVGFGYQGIVNSVQSGGRPVNYVLFITPGIITFQIMSVAIQTGMTLFMDKQMGMFEQILAGPFTRRDYVTSKIVSILIQGLGSGLFVLLIAIPVMLGTLGNLLSPENILIVVVSLTMTALFFGSLMISVVGFIKSSQKFNILFNTLYLPITFLSSAFYPLATMPKLLSTIAYANPLTYDADLLRSGLLGTRTGLEPIELLVALTVGVGSLMIAFLVFRKVTVEE
jgi:ABC-2 type transport system permease protein